MFSITSLVTFVAGAASVAAFAPLGLYPLALVTFAWLAHAWTAHSPRQCLWIGFAFGLGYFGGGVSWVYVSLHSSAACRRRWRRLRRLSSSASLRSFPPS